MTFNDGVFKWEGLPEGSKIIHCGRNICLMIPKKSIEKCFKTQSVSLYGKYVHNIIDVIEVSKE